MEHDGHRQRILQKFKAGDIRQDHELLEILLFNAYPRKNTNPVAHTLMQTFGTLKGVFEADYNDLVAIDGIGESVALYIKCVGACARPAYAFDAYEKHLKNYGDFKAFASMRLRSKTEEVLELYFLEKSGRIKYIYSHSADEEHRVTISRGTVPSLVATVAPFGLVIAHNHLMGSSAPSSADDEFTQEVAEVCRLYGVKLYDHCIYASDNDVYSYFFTDRI